MIAGPCVMCGLTDYALSCGGPTICPSCDSGNFGYQTVARQRKEIERLRNSLNRPVTALADLPPEPPPPWWCGAVIPTGRYRLKLDPWGHPHLQQLVTDTGGVRKRWTYIATVMAQSSDDE